MAQYIIQFSCPDLLAFEMFISEHLFPQIVNLFCKQMHISGKLKQRGCLKSIVSLSLPKAIKLIANISTIPMAIGTI